MSFYQSFIIFYPINYFLQYGEKCVEAAKRDIEFDQGWDEELKKPDVDLR